MATDARAELRVDVDFYLVRKGRIDVDELYREPERSAHGDVNWGAIAAFPISTRLLGGAELSWLVGIVVAGGAYLAFGRRVAAAPMPQPTGAGR